MPPAVMPRTKVRRPITQITRKRDWHLGDSFALEGRLDDHLAGEFHSVSAQVKPLETDLGKRPQAAMGVTDAGAE
jgi:hypothetical protein